MNLPTTTARVPLPSRQAEVRFDASSTSAKVVNKCPRIAIAHDYLTQRGGAERVVLSMARAFPESPIYTTLYEPESTYPEFTGLDIRVSRLNAIGVLRKNHRLALPVLSLTSSLINIDADIVVVSSSGWAHGFSTRGQKLVYCHSPARWLYQKETYLGTNPRLTQRLASEFLGKPLRRWDRKAAASCDQYLANSSVVQERILMTYGRESLILPAPLSWNSSGPPSPNSKVNEWLGDEPYALCVSRLLPYKNVDKVIEALQGVGLRLIVVGKGPEEGHLRTRADDGVLMLSDLPEEEIRWLYSRCELLVAASREDYGLTPIEAASFGKPSVVLRWGGFLDTVTEDETGVFFDHPSSGDIAKAVVKARSMSWNADQIRHAAERFSEERFIHELQGHVARLAGSAAR